MLRIRAGILAAVLSMSTLATCAAPGSAVIKTTVTTLPETSPFMNSAGYWIGRLKNQDKRIMDEAAIDAFNREIRNQGNVEELAAYTPPKGCRLRRALKSDANWIVKRGFFQSDGSQVEESIIAPLMEEMNLDAIPREIANRFGFLTTGADVRVLPTAAPLFETPGDTHFDRLQTSALEPGEPLRILHHTEDGKWTYAITERVKGWLPSKAIVEVDEETFLKRYRSENIAVVIALRADLYSDPALTRFHDAVRMGTRLLLAPANPEVADNGRAQPPSTTNTASAVPVTMPVRQSNGAYRETTFWVDRSEISVGFLPYTPRNAIRQAFKLLNAPYGWGGMFGEQDCSQLILEIFSTMGIVLPRSSRNQVDIGTPIPEITEESIEEEKVNALLKDAVPGITLLGMPGHIMLYLGVVDGRPYAIHAAWAYWENRDGEDKHRLINRVAVSSLTLGEGSKRGSYLHRLQSAMVVAPPTPSAPN